MATQQLSPIATQVAHEVSETDTHIMEAWNLTAWEWSYTLTDSQRRYCRFNVVNAPAFKAGN